MSRIREWLARTRWRSRGSAPRLAAAALSPDAARVRAVLRHGTGPP